MRLSNELLANVAHDYYLSELTISEISSKYDLSRYLVDRALKESKERGIVQISIKENIKRNVHLEQIFRKEFGLKGVFILKRSASKNQDSEKASAFAASQIEEYMKSAHNVGLTWGTTMRDVVNSFSGEKNPDLNFVQMVGYPMHSSSRKTPLEPAAAKKFSASFQVLPAPLYVNNPKLNELLKSEPFYQDLDDNYNNMDLIITCLGTVQSLEENRFLGEKYKNLLFKDIDTKNIAGMILGRAYDYDGHFFSAITDKIIGISDYQIMKTPVRFAIVTNRFKTDAMIGALKTGIITHLVTNESIAERALQKLNYKS